MEITLYKNFAKVSNSTKRPSDGTTYDCKFKDNTSYHNPQVLLAASFSDLAGVTYGYMDDNYYYVQDIVSVANGLTQVTLRNDPMASWKGTIGGYTGLLNRAPSDSYINTLADDTISPTADIVNVSHVSIDTPGISGLSFSTGSYIIKATGAANGLNLGDVVTATGLSQFLSGLGDDFFAKPDLIASITWVPFTISQLSPGLGSIKNSIWVGNREITVENGVYPVLAGARVNSAVTVENSLSSIYSDARKILGQYSTFIIETFGQSFNLDAAYLNSSSFIVQNVFDITNCNLRLKVTAQVGDENVILVNISTGLGIDIPFATSKPDIKALTAAVLSKGMTFISGPDVINLSGITGPSPSGSIISAMDASTVTFRLIQKGSTEKDPDKNGYPYMHVSNPNSLGTGYYQYVKSNLAIADIKDENDTINSYLSSGFYYE